MAKLLVVEDDENLVKELEELLGKEQHTVDTAGDGISAQEMLQNFVYELVVLDVNIPEMNGIDLCAWFRQNGGATPVLMLTGMSSISDKERGLDSGADDYLTKPFAFAELLARLRALLRRSHSQATPHLCIADLELDPVAHKVWRQGQEISLTNKEYALLEYLMRNAGRVLTRTAITEHVWDIHYEAVTNFVDVHIKSLRSKMDRDFSPQLIHTVRGAGYVLKIPEI